MLTWVYLCVVERLAWPSSSWMTRTSAPPASRWVANECRSACGLTLRWSASWSTVRSRCRATLREVSRPPRWLRKSAAGSWPRCRLRQELAAPLEPPPERGDAPGVHRAQALLPALAEHPDGPGAQVEVVHVQPAGLAHPEARAVEQLEQSAVAQPERSVLAGDGEDREHLVHREHVGKPGGELRTADGARRVGGHAAGGHEMPVERADGGQSPGAAPRGVVHGERAEPPADARRGRRWTGSARHPRGSGRRRVRR